VRTFSEAVHDVAPERLRRVAEGIAAAHGMTVDVDYHRGYPVLVNHAPEVERIGEVTRAMFGDRAFFEPPQPIAGAEDFAYVLNEVPGAYLGLGAAPVGEDPVTAAYNHSAQARFAEEALAIGPAVLAGLALHRLADGA
jgi:hippurate hydrolase